jgi:hypothetical protein
VVLSNFIRRREVALECSLAFSMPEMVDLILKFFDFRLILNFKIILNVFFKVINEFIKINRFNILFFKYFLKNIF